MEYTGTITSKRILELIDKSLEIALKFGCDPYDYPNRVTFGWGTAVSKTFGICKFPITPEDNFFILLNPMVEKASDEEIMNLILHELGHYFVGADAILNEDIWFNYDNRRWQCKKQLSREIGHGTRWKRLVDKFGSALGIPITRTDSIHFQDMRDEVAKRKKYNFRCKNCGATFGYEKRTKFVDTYNDIASDGKPQWSCGRCQAGKHTGDEPPFELIK